MKNRSSRLRTKIGGAIAAAGLVALGIIAPQIATAAPAPEAGDSVWVGGAIGYNGATAHAVYSERPADAPPTSGGPQSYWEAADFWAYCIEHDESANPGATGVLGDFDSALANSLFTGPNAKLVQAKVMWLLTHSLPVISLDDFHAASGLTNVTTDDLVMATQYAIWRYTDLGFDAQWRAWVDDPATYGNARDAYWYLVNGANADTATAPVTPAPITVSVDAPPAGQEAATLVGPFTVHTNQATVSVTTDSGLSIVDVNGNLVDVSAVVDGQQLYLDATGVVDAGAATITAAAEGSSATGLVLNVPLDNGSMTPDAHAQTMILAAKSTANTTASADTTWAAVPQPAIGTTLVDSADGDKVLGWNGGTVIDTIAYQNLTPGVEYTVTGELMLKSDGSATGITGTTTFTPTAADGTTTVSFMVPVGFGGEVLVAYEELFESADLVTPVAVHQDINDAAQTVTVETPPVVVEPAIGTSLVDSVDGDHVLPATGGTVVDTVAYQNLTVGTEYTITGELMLKSDGTATGVTGTVTFTPTAASGSVEVTFEVPAGFAGEALVAYEELFESADLATPVAVHQDINDAAQTVTVEQPAPVPAIGTTLVDSADGDKVLGWNGGTVIDTVAYQNLTPGVEYTVTGELMLKSDGSATGITGTTTFTPTAADGTTTVSFAVPVGFGGEVLVAYEELFESADLVTPVAVHQDINDAAQTVTVETPPVVVEPAIGTSLVDSADGDHVLPAAGGTVVDTVAYQNLTPGVEYTITGELMLKDDGTATGVTGTVTFTPAAANGSVEVTFEVPAGFAGEALVAYEELFESADLVTPVAVHQDINDAAQTVTVEQPTTPTPTPTPTPSVTPTPTPTPTPTVTPSTTPSAPVVPSTPAKPSGPTGLPTTGMDLGPAPLVAAVALLGMGAFILIARRRASSQR